MSITLHALLGIHRYFTGFYKDVYVFFAGDPAILSRQSFTGEESKLSSLLKYRTDNDGGANW